MHCAAKLLYGTVDKCIESSNEVPLGLLHFPNRSLDSPIGLSLKLT